MKLRYSRIIQIFIILSVIWSCESNHETSKENIVAKVGNEIISIKDLETSIILNPQYSIRTSIRKARLNQVNYLINEEYYYLASKNAGLIDDPVITKRLKYIKNQEILRTYINEKFVNKVEIKSSEVENGIEKIKTQLNITNFFFSNHDSAAAFKKNITNVFQNDLENDRLKVGKDLDWITFGDLEIDIENVVYQLNIGEISDIIKSKYGFHILVLNEKRINEDIKYTPLNTLEHNVSEIIKKRKINNKIESLVNELSEGEKIKINNNIINFLSKHINELIEKRKYNPTILIPPLQNSELESIKISLDNLLEDELVVFKNTAWSTSEFLERLKEMPPFHRPYLGTRKRLVQSILDLIKNDLLLENALKNGYDKNNESMASYNKNKKEYLASYFKSIYLSNEYKNNFPEKYEIIKNSLKLAKDENESTIDSNNLFRNINNPDSIMMDAPIPVLLKNKYSW